MTICGGAEGTGERSFGATGWGLMATEQYSTLASVYEWLVPDTMLEPEGAVAAFGAVVDSLRAGARLLDCATGTGQLAVGLALRGYEVVASDASELMIERTRSLAAQHRVGLQAITCAWDDLGRVVGGPFDAVFCVGNSLTHAVGQEGRRAALTAMRSVLRDGGLLAATSRNWERLRDERPALEVDRQVTHRAGRSGLVVRGWTIPQSWDAPHHLDVAVAVLGNDGSVETTGEQLIFWPFTREALYEDLRVSGLVPMTSTYSPDADRYLVTARR